MKKYFRVMLISTIASTAAYLSAGAALKSVTKIKAPPEYDRTSGIHRDQDDSGLLNKPAPGFELPGLDGKMYSLKNLKGKIVVLNFWFIACKPCVNEMPVLNSLKKNRDPKKVLFLALSLDSKNAVNAFLKLHQFDYTMLPDAAPIHKKYHLNAYPASIVIDARGIVSFVQIGGPDIGDNLSAAINAALKGA